ncbi:MAG: hypothetical protein QXP53_01260 [Candidatus Pacearchaeota archaeon]
MNKNFILIVLILLVVFAIGAVIPSCSPKGPKFNATSLILNFVENAPPAEINYGVGFPIYVEVRNSGGYDVPAGAGIFYLSGIGQNLIGVQTKLSNLNMLAKKTEMQQGGSEILSFATNAQVAQQLPNAFNITMKLTSCYNYATIMQTNICVGRGGGVCSISGNKIETGSNTVGPIQVTELTEQIQGNKLYLSFKVNNRGAGEVYLTDSDCDKLEQGDVNEQLKKGKADIAIRVEQGFLCNLQSSQAPYSSVKALEGVVMIGYTIVCEKILTGTESHLAPVEIVLSYKYRESTTKGLTILPP